MQASKPVVLSLFVAVVVCSPLVVGQQWRDHDAWYARDDQRQPGAPDARRNSKNAQKILVSNQKPKDSVGPINNNGGIGTISPDGPVVMQLQLLSYKGANGGRLPLDLQCHWKPPQTPNAPIPEETKCQLSFVTNIYTLTDKLHAWATQYYSPTGGTINLAQGTWRQPIKVFLHETPKSIDVTVTHHGNVAHANNGSLYAFNVVALAEAFSFDLSQLPSTGGAMRRVTVEASLMRGNQLQLQYSLQCAGNKKGDNCNMNDCKSLPNNNKLAVCNTTHGFSLCQWSGGGREVSGCTTCPHGVNRQIAACCFDAACADASAGPSTRSAAGSAWVVAFWIAIAFIIILILFILAMFGGWCFTRRNKERQSAWTRWPPVRATERDEPVKEPLATDGFHTTRAPPRATIDEVYQTTVAPSGQRNGVAGSQHGSSTGGNDERESQSSYGMRPDGRIAPRREAQV